MRLIALVFATSLLLARAETFEIPTKKPAATVTFPDDWKIRESDNGVDGTSADQLLYIAIGFVEAGSTGKFLESALNFLKLNGVEVDNESARQQDMALNGMEVVDVQWKGTDSGGPCEVTLDLIGLSDAEGLMILYWAPPGADSNYAEELKGIFESIRPLKHSPEAAGATAE